MSPTHSTSLTTPTLCHPYLLVLGLVQVVIPRRQAEPRLIHLDDVAVGVFGVGADVDGEEGRGAVVRSHLLQRRVEVVLGPGARDVPAAQLGKRGLG